MLTKRQNTPTKVLMKSEIGNTRITEYLQSHEIIGSGRLVDPAHPLEGTEQQGEMPIGQPLATNEGVECRLEILLTLRSSLPLGRLGRLRGGSGIGRSRLRSLRRGIRLVEVRAGHDNDATVDRAEKRLGIRVV